ncbi:iron-containing alcohol dehydrogenase [Weeksellaceae bacterium KMM 9713]|uniref:Iron-containing alcohol dehydrogenase n=1 Tax=Profundicola chukchiensis TaxID=2961959 RepID=A0A9X4MZ73_9FLAO|nr:iron-containing alcohol dehydrogenase [Profundicola chukchiensis]MDG4945455.1 iron-containing alcohol dehydrogenase [Profundicola chukchiensis]
MNNFIYQNPTKIIFGEGQIERLSKEIPADSKILMLYGGGSIKKNGVYDQTTEALKSHQIIEFGGVPANPEYEILMEAVEVVKKENIEFILAVGGGSVIDGAKFISAASKYDGDTWEMVKTRAKIDDAIPFGTVLTLPATGSEMNSGFVVSRRETKEKLSMGSPLLFPQFSILDPNVINSIPERQVVNGIVDAFNHVLEQYMTYPIGADLQDRFAESILSTLMNDAPKVLENREDYAAKANFMWSCTMALNGLISQGVPTDWAVHAMGHELTALYGIDHARTLAIIGIPHYKHNFEAKKEKLAQYAERVWGITEGSLEDKAKQAIDKTEEFYHSLGVKTKLSEYAENIEKTAETIEQRFTDRGWSGIGENQIVTPQDARMIVEMSY